MKGIVSLLGSNSWHRRYPNGIGLAAPLSGVVKATLSRPAGQDDCRHLLRRYF
jgi:hypothetical protein